MEFSCRVFSLLSFGGAALTKHLLIQLPAFTEACYEYHKVHAVVHELTGKSQERFSCYVHQNVFSAVK